jgi:hypothetical protein
MKPIERGTGFFQNLALHRLFWCFVWLQMTTWNILTVVVQLGHQEPLIIKDQSEYIGYFVAWR